MKVSMVTMSSAIKNNTWSRKAIVSLVFIALSAAFIKKYSSVLTPPYVIFISFFAFFILLAARHILYWSWLWQIKEYRADRMRAHFQDVGLKNSILAGIGYSAMRAVKMPKFTMKAILIFFISLFFNTAIMFFIIWNFSPSIHLDSLQNRFFIFLSERISAVPDAGEYRVTIEFLIEPFLGAPLAVFLSVFFLNILSFFPKKIKIIRAKEKIKKMPNLTVVGITGSYGKSTTKEILAAILEKKFSVLKTPVNINTPIGIAQVVLGELRQDHRIFVVEMGAYKKGEIKEICDMVKPKIGIITAINEQHLALFGNIQNTIDAKFELIESLPKNGFAILNIGDENIQKGLEARKNLKAEARLYSVEAKADIYATDLAVGGQGVKFKLVSGMEFQDFRANIAGKHNISNILAAIIASNRLGIGFAENSQLLQRIDRLPFGLKILPGPNISTLIDDTYNSNPDGVSAVLNYLRTIRGKKIIVMASLIELGSAANKIHKNLGKEISKVAARLILTDDYYAEQIKSGVKENNSAALQVSADVKIEKNPDRIARRLKQELKESDVVVFINRGAGKVLELLKK